MVVRVEVYSSSSSSSRCPCPYRVVDIFRRRLFGVMLRASQGRLKYAGRPTASWAVKMEAWWVEETAPLIREFE